MRLATENPVRIQGFSGSISCLQIYHDALTGPQIKSVRNICFQTGKLIPSRSKITGTTIVLDSFFGMKALRMRRIYVKNRP